jgi:ribosomal protein S18 acetylase RimI-like enzyme
MTGRPPEAPIAASRLRRIEDWGLNSSRPPAELLYDGWLLRFSPGKAKRARCVNALEPGTIAPEEKISRCERLYAEAGLPAIFRITPFSRPGDLEAVLESRNYRKFDLTCVETADLAAMTPPMPDPRVEAAPLDTYVRAVGELRGSTTGHVAAHAARLQSVVLPRRQVLVREGGKVLAAGLAIAEDDAVGLFDIVVDPRQRRRGLARAVVSTLLSQAIGEGARTAYLQVDEANAAARALYARFGFSTAYHYWYRAREGDQH